jgi:hypothetical protein
MATKPFNKHYAATVVDGTDQAIVIPLDIKAKMGTRDHFAGFQVIMEASGVNSGAPFQRIPFPPTTDSHEPSARHCA